MPVYKNVNNKIDKKTGKERTVTTYYVSVRYKDWEGKNQRHVKRGFATKREAKEYETNFLANVTNSCTQLFEDVTKKYMENRKLKNLKLSTLENKQYLISKHLLPTFGKMPVNAITPIHIEQWQKKMLASEKKYAPTYIYTINNILNTILKYAVNYLNLGKNPADATESIGTARNDHFDFWTPDEFKKFLDALNDKEANAKAQIKRRCSDYVLTMAFTILFYTGLREGELLALTSNDIDLEKQTISVTKTFKRLKSQDYLSSPKTKNSTRVIKISATLTEKIKEYLSSIVDLQPTDRIFESINVSNLFRAIHSSAKLAGIKEIRVHDLRHSCCSLLFHLGCTPLQVKTYLGHKNIQITLNIYAHLYPESMDEISQKVQSVEERYQKGITDEK